MENKADSLYDKTFDYVIDRYLVAQDYIVSEEVMEIFKYTHPGPSSYERAVQELTAGLKETHWMWWIFPQIKGLKIAYKFY